MDESCHTCEHVASHICMSNVTHVACGRIVCRDSLNVFLDPFIPVTWLICTCAVTYLHVWHGSHDACTCHMCYMRNVDESCNTRGMTHSWHGTDHWYVWHDSWMCVCVTRLVDTCDLPHSCVWHDSFMCVTWLIHVCDMTRSYVYYDTFAGWQDARHVGSCICVT